MLHDRIDLTVEMLRKKPLTLKRKRVQGDKTTSVPPIGAPSWCLNREALEKFNRITEDIPLYDYDTDEDNNNNSEEDTNKNKENPSKRKRKKSKQKEEKQKKKNQNQSSLLFV